MSRMLPAWLSSPSSLAPIDAVAVALDVPVDAVAGWL